MSRTMTAAVLHGARDVRIEAYPRPELRPGTALQRVRRVGICGSFLGVPMIATIVVLSLFTVTYTALGGLKAVVMTENVQALLLLGGAALVTVPGLRALARAKDKQWSS